MERTRVQVAEVCHNSPHPGPLPEGEGDFFNEHCAAHLPRERGLRLGACTSFSTVACNHFNCCRISGKLADHRLLDLLLAFGRGGDADHAAAVGHVVGDAGHGPQHGAVADVDVVADAHLPGHDHVVAGRGAAGDAHLRAEHVVAADAAIVGDHDLVVDLRPLADHGGAVGAAIDGRAGADLDVGARTPRCPIGPTGGGGRRPGRSRSRRPPTPRRRGSGSAGRRPCFRTAPRWGRWSHPRRSASRP